MDTQATTRGSELTSGGTTGPAAGGDADPTRGGVFAGIRETALMVGSALLGCAVLIGFIAALSMCWTIHPLLTVVAAAALTWLTVKLSGKLFRTY